MSNISLQPVGPGLAPALQQLVERSPAEQRDQGHQYTVAEILQQPALWMATATDAALAATLAEALAPKPDAIVLTGSGSSFYIGEALAPALQQALGVPVIAVPGGTLLTHWRQTLPPGNVLLVSFARSGNSPESIGVVDTLLQHAPQCRHLFITCNADGGLATRYRDVATAHCALLDPRSNDHSLVMTSSFTSMFMAGRMLDITQPVRHWSGVAATAGDDMRALLAGPAQPLHGLASQGFDSVVYLGDAGRFGGAHESALKMLEMSGGKVQVMAETFLGLRHGPMSALREDSVLVAMLSNDPRIRAYQDDLLAELDQKKLARRRILIGGKDVVATADTIHVGCQLADDDATLIDVATGQLLALFRCMALGQQPDAPSQGVLTRVVQPFRIHAEADAA